MGVRYPLTAALQRRAERADTYGGDGTNNSGPPLPSSLAPLPLSCEPTESAVETGRGIHYGASGGGGTNSIGSASSANHSSKRHRKGLLSFASSAAPSINGGRLMGAAAGRVFTFETIFANQKMTLVDYGEAAIIGSISSRRGGDTTASQTSGCNPSGGGACDVEEGALEEAAGEDFTVGGQDPRRDTARLGAKDRLAFEQRRRRMQRRNEAWLKGEASVVGNGGGPLGSNEQSLRRLSSTGNYSFANNNAEGEDDMGEDDDDDNEDAAGGQKHRLISLGAHSGVKSVSRMLFLLKSQHQSQSLHMHPQQSPHGVVPSAAEADWSAEEWQPPSPPPSVVSRIAPYQPYQHHSQQQQRQQEDETYMYSARGTNAVLPFVADESSEPRPAPASPLAAHQSARRRIQPESRFNVVNDSDAVGPRSTVGGWGGWPSAVDDSDHDVFREGEEGDEEEATEAEEEDVMVIDLRAVNDNMWF